MSHSEDDQIHRQNNLATLNILSLDSSSPVASVAFVSSDSIDRHVTFSSDTPHQRISSSALFEGLQAAVTACGFPDAVCVGLGPGSYNGLRAGIAAARAFATARRIPLLALPSPLALPGPDSGFWALGDARGENYWVACVQSGAFLEEPRLLSPAETVAHLQTRPGLSVLASAPLSGIEIFQQATPDAVRLAILSIKAHPIAGTPGPLYLKPPHITSPRS